MQSNAMQSYSLFHSVLFYSVRSCSVRSCSVLLVCSGQFCSILCCRRFYFGVLCSISIESILSNRIETDHDLNLIRPALPYSILSYQIFSYCILSRVASNDPTVCPACDVTRNNHDRNRQIEDHGGGVGKQCVCGVIEREVAAKCRYGNWISNQYSMGLRCFTACSRHTLSTGLI